MKRVATLLAITGCVGEPPSPNPPPTWGVPISGGTMLVTRDGARAVIADPDRDRIMTVDLESERVTEEPLPAGSEPGRLVEDNEGRIHIALRGSGKLLTLGGETRVVCGEPRGLAVDGELVHVACATGELVSFPAAGGAAVRTLKLERDLRDVIVVGTQLVVSKFRSAELLTLDAQGTIISRTQPGIVQRTAAFEGSGSGGAPSGSGAGSGMLVDAIPTVAWRTIALPDGRLVVAHQRKVDQVLRFTTGGYSGDCGQGPVESAITIVTPGAEPFAAQPFMRGALPVDVATNGDFVAVATAGSKSVQMASTSALTTPDRDPCGIGNGVGIQIFNDELGAPTSIAFRGKDLAIYYPELPALVIHPNVQWENETSRTIRLPGALGYDSGRALFHAQTFAGISCASCHPEGREDGQVWRFEDIGTRRTQSLAGGILGRGPYHWAGDMTDLTMLMANVFTQRMAGGATTRSQQLSLGPWLDRIPAPEPIAISDEAAVTRGQTLFMSQELGCISCHAGPLYTNNMLVNVGTGGVFKVPSLIGIGARAPFMHDGCAATLTDRFGTCGGGDLHGRTTALTEIQRADLVAYLESL